MDKSKFYFEIHSGDFGGVAFAPEDCLYEYSERIKEVDLLPFDMTIDEGFFEDYLANDLGWPLMSLKLKTFFEQYAQAAPAHKWVKVKVILGQNFQYYYYLVILEKPHILDLNRTRIINDDYIVGVFLFSRINKFSFFSHASVHNNDIIVSNELKLGMEKLQISGICFEKAEVTLNKL